MKKTKISRSSNHGLVDAKSCVGGLIGHVTDPLSITSSYTNSILKTKSETYGPIVGRIDETDEVTFKSTYWIQQDDEQYCNSIGQKTDLKVQNLETILQM